MTLVCFELCFEGILLLRDNCSLGELRNLRLLTLESCNSHVDKMKNHEGAYLTRMMPKSLHRLSNTCLVLKNVVELFSLRHNVIWVLGPYSSIAHYLFIPTVNCLSKSKFHETVSSTSLSSSLEGLVSLNSGSQADKIIMCEKLLTIKVFINLQNWNTSRRMVEHSFSNKNGSLSLILTRKMHIARSDQAQNPIGFHHSFFVSILRTENTSAGISISISNYSLFGIIQVFLARFAH